MKIPSFLTFVLPLAGSLTSVQAFDNAASVSALQGLNLNKGTSFVDHAQFDFNDFILTNLCVSCFRPTPDAWFDCNFNFDWEDSNYNGSSHCSGNWNWDGVTQEHGDKNDYSEDYIVCGEGPSDFWQYKFDDMHSMWNITFTLTHMSKDTVHWRPNTEYAHLFSVYANITLNKQPVEKTEQSLIYEHPGPLNATVNGLVI